MSIKLGLFNSAFISFGLLVQTSAIAAPSQVIKEKTIKVRERTLKGEKKYKFNKGEKTELDFGAADILGSVKSPLGSMVDSVQSDKEYDFVKVRLSWKPEMAQSAGTLETGQSIK